MFGLGLWELIIIIMLLFVVSKPEDLPHILGKVGHLYGQCQRIYFTILDEIKLISSINTDPKKPSKKK